MAKEIIPQRTYVKVYKAELASWQKMQLTGLEWDVLMVIAEKTWGWRKESVSISFAEIAKLTGHNRRRVTSAIACLRLSGILQATGQQRAVQHFSINPPEAYHLVTKRTPVYARNTKTTGDQNDTSSDVTPPHYMTGDQNDTKSGDQNDTNLVTCSGVKSQSLLINNPNKKKERKESLYIEGDSRRDGIEGNSFNDSQGKTTYSPETPSLGATTLRERVHMHISLYGPSRVSSIARALNMSTPRLCRFFREHSQFPRVSRGVYGPPVYAERQPQPAPTQDKLLRALREGPKSVVELREQLKMADNTVRVYLSRLKKQEIVVKTGKQYALAQPGMVSVPPAQTERDKIMKAFDEGQVPECPKCGNRSWGFDAAGRPVCSCGYVLGAGQ